MPGAEQLVLRLQARAELFLTDFTGPAFDGLLGIFEQLLVRRDVGILLAGEPDGARSILLHALSLEGYARGCRSGLLDLAEWRDFAPEMLDGLEQLDLAIIDNIDAVLGNPGWEESLFHFYNRCQASGTPWVVGSIQPALALPVALPDLRSRLSQMMPCMVPVIDDACRQQLLRSAFSRRRMQLLPEVERWLLTCGPRSLAVLVRCVEAIDEESLRDKRRLSVPFVSSIVSRIVAASHD